MAALNRSEGATAFVATGSLLDPAIAVLAIGTDELGGSIVCGHFSLNTEGIPA